MTNADYAVLALLTNTSVQAKTLLDGFKQITRNIAVYMNTVHLF